MNEQKFLRRKDCRPVLRYKKDLQSVNMNNEKEPNCSLMKVYVLTIEVYVSFAKICFSFFFFTADGILKFRIKDHDPAIIVTHQQDLKDLFPNVDIDAL